MSSAEAFPLYFPGDLRRAFDSDAVTRRIAKVCGFTKGARVLELGCGPAPAAITLARDFGCQVIAVDSDEQVVALARDKVRAAGVQERVDVRKVSFDALPFGEGELDGIVIQGRVLFPFETGAERLRRLLAPKGKLVLTWPVKVGRFPARASVEFWEQRLGEPLRLPRELLGVFERRGYEPLSIETATDAEIDDAYKLIEQDLASLAAERAEPLRAEIDLHRSSGGKASVSFALAMGRRKEPGERPPASRDRG